MIEKDELELARVDCTECGQSKEIKPENYPNLTFGDVRCTDCLTNIRKVRAKKRRKAWKERRKELFKTQPDDVIICNLCQRPKLRTDYPKWRLGRVCKNCEHRRRRGASITDVNGSIVIKVHNDTQPQTWRVCHHCKQNRPRTDFNWASYGLPRSSGRCFACRKARDEELMRVRWEIAKRRLMP